MSDSVTPLINSRRRFEKLTYTPLVLALPNEDEPRDALGTAALVRMLAISSDELAKLDRAVLDRTQRIALAAIEQMQSAVSGPAAIASASALGRVPTSALLGVATALRVIREQARDTLSKGLLNLDNQFQKETTGNSARSDGKAKVAPPAPAKSATLATTDKRSGSVARQENLRSADQSVKSRATPKIAPIPAPDVSTIPQISVPATVVSTAPAVESIVTRGGELATLAGQPATRSILGPRVASRIAGVLAWAADGPTDRLAPLLDVAASYYPSMDGPALLLAALGRIDKLVEIAWLFADALTRRPLQPLGLLHLERLVMDPLEIERGELLYSLPLAPDEKVTLSHKEWTVHEEQFSQFIEDYLENYSETGVAQSDDMAMATSSETLHSNALNLSQPLASAQGVNVTTPVDTTSSSGSSVQNDTARQESTSRTRTVTATASARTIKDQKTSFTVTTVSGSTDFTAHLIENKYKDKSMRIDYFRRVRKWQSSLYRYGVRLTYDVVIPDPGQKLRERQIELQTIASELADEFVLDLTIAQITPSSWETLASEYDVQLPAPPDAYRLIENTLAVDYPPNDEVTIHGTVHTRQKIDQLTLALPSGFVFSSLTAIIDVSTWHVTFQNQWITVLGSGGVGSFSPDASGYIQATVNFDLSQLPESGGASATFWSQYVSSGILKLAGTIVPTENSLESWRMQCYAVIRDAAYAQYAQHRSYLRDRQSALLKEIAAEDTLRLRRTEREQIMRAILEWLFPGFEDASSILTLITSPGTLDPATWQQVMEYGEYIKFVQTAIDWDHVMIFLYPYFWDTYWNAEEKIFLDHPDPIHREFLRAGAARVIVAINPGFEDQVVTLLDQGQLGQIPEQSRFAQVIKDVQDANAAYAATAANPDPTSLVVNEPGILIGQWTDYTPSGALDIQVTLEAVKTSA